MGKTDAPSWIDYGHIDAKNWERPNVIFLMVDDIGPYDLGCYGGEQIPTPNLDRMAAEGTRFTDCYAGSTVCAPSRSALMTGQHTGHTRVRSNHATVGGAWIDDQYGRGTVPLQGNDTTVAEVMSAAGYTTGCIGKWGLGDLGTGGTPSKQGFDTFYGYLDQIHAHNYYPEFLIRNEEKEPIPENDDGGEWSLGPESYPAGQVDKGGVHAHDRLVEESLNFIRDHADEDFFCYLPWTFPHGPHHVPQLEAFVEDEWTEEEQGCASMIARLDRAVGDLLDCLTEQGIDDDTIVFFCSDHGPNESFVGEPLESAGPLRGYKGLLYEGGIRTPMLVRWPGQVPAGRVDDTPWYHPDVLPTLAELAGLDFVFGDLDVETDGLSVVRTLLGGEQPLDRRYLYWEFPQQGETEMDLSQAARFADWKALRPLTDERIELYDLSDDVGEANDVSSEHPDIVGRFERYFEQAREESKHWPTW